MVVIGLEENEPVMIARAASKRVEVVGVDLTPGGTGVSPQSRECRPCVRRYDGSEAIGGQSGDEFLKFSQQSVDVVTQLIRAVGPGDLREGETDRRQRNGRYLRQREELTPSERLFKRLEDVVWADVEPVVWIVALAIPDCGKVGGELCGESPCIGRITRGRLRVNVAQGESEKPADWQCGFGRAVVAPGAVCQKPSAVVNVARGGDRSAYQLDCGDTSYLRDE